MKKIARNVKKQKLHKHVTYKSQPARVCVSLHAAILSALPSVWEGDQPWGKFEEKRHQEKREREREKEREEKGLNVTKNKSTKTKNWIFR